MFDLIADIRCSLPYKSGSIICGILSLIAFFGYNLTHSHMCQGEGALLVLPILLITTLASLLDILIFIGFNIFSFIWVFFKEKQGYQYNIFADIGYFFTIIFLFHFLFDVLLGGKP